jgi:cysteine synthase A
MIATRSSQSPTPRLSRWPARPLASRGIFSGPSTGANLVAAVRLARTLGPDRRVVTVQVDSGLKYLTSKLYA